MWAKQAAVILTLCALLTATTAVAPKATYAMDSGEIAGIAVGGYIAVVLFGAAMYQYSKGLVEVMPEVRRPEREMRPEEIRVGPRCAQRSPTVTLLCW